jgi:hypothetical protein
MVVKCLVFIICLIVLSTNHVFSQDTTKQFKPYGVLGGYFFGDFAYKAGADSLKRGNVEYSGLPAKQSSFNIRRLYLTYNYYLSPKFSSELVLAYEGQTPTTSTRNIFIKYLNVKWSNVFKRTDLLFGQLRIPFIINMENLYGYRSIEKTVADMRGVASSSDLGIAVQGRLNKKENVSYSVIVANGSGVHPENDQYKRLYTNLNGKFLKNTLNIDLNYSYELASSSTHKSRHSYKLGVVYKTSGITIGAECFDNALLNYANAIPEQSDDTMAVNESAIGLSFFINKKISEKITSFARYDYYNPDAIYDSKNNYISPYNTNTEHFFTAGIDFQPVQNVHIMPNIWYNHFHNKIAAENIPGATNADVVLRLTVFVLYQ